MWLVLPRLSGTLAGSPTTRGETCFQGMATTAFLEKGEPFQERSPQHSVSTKGLELCASQPRGPFSLKTALIDLVREACAKEANSPYRYAILIASCSTTPPSVLEGSLHLRCFTCKSIHFKSGAEGFESLTSAVQRRRYALLELSRAYKIAANRGIWSTTLSQVFQEFCSGCCTVAAPMLRFAYAQCPVRSLFDQPPQAPSYELRVRSVPRGQQLMSPSAEDEAGAREDCIRNCREYSSNCEDAPSVTCTLH
jgi:hypothetical protein